MLEILVVLSLILYLVSSIILWIYLFNRKRFLIRLGFSTLGIGYITQLIYIGIRDFKEKTFYISAHTDIPFFLAFILMSIFYFFILFYREKLKELSSFVSTINTILIALTLPHIHGAEKLSLKNTWFHLHIIFSTVALGLIIFSFIIALIYFFLERDLKKKNLNSFFISKLSISVTTIQNLISKINILIFISLTLSLISSAIWTSVYKNIHWLSGTREISLIGVLIYYGFLVHLNIFFPDKKNLQMRATILGALISFIIFIFTKH